MTKLKLIKHEYDNQQTKWIEKIFSYGTLQDKSIQLRLFNRLLIGVSDMLIGYFLLTIKIQEADRENTYPIAIYTGNDEDKIKGTVFSVSSEELAKADIYEGQEYERVKIWLSSGVSSWIYVRGRAESGKNR